MDQQDRQAHVDRLTRRCEKLAPHLVTLAQYEQERNLSHTIARSWAKRYKEDFVQPVFGEIQPALYLREALDLWVEKKRRQHRAFGRRRDARRRS